MYELVSILSDVEPKYKKVSTNLYYMKEMYELISIGEDSSSRWLLLSHHCNQLISIRTFLLFVQICIC